MKKTNQYCYLIFYEFITSYLFFKKKSATELIFIMENVFPKWIVHLHKQQILRYPVDDVLKMVKTWKRQEVALFIQDKFGLKVHNKNAKTWKIYDHAVAVPCDQDWNK